MLVHDSKDDQHLIIITSYILVKDIMVRYLKRNYTIRKEQQRPKLDKYTIGTNNGNKIYHGAINLDPVCQCL